MSEKSEPQGGAKLLIDLGPLLVFFLVNFFAPVPQVLKIFVATGAFMAAMIAAMLYSYARFRSISPLLWFSGVMVILQPKGQGRDGDDHHIEEPWNVEEL